MRKLICLLLAAALCLGLYLGLSRNSDGYPAASAREMTETKTLVRDGVKYFPRQDITVVMLLGIDRFGTLTDSASWATPAEADTVHLLILDETEETARVLTLNRDTLVEQGAGELPLAGVFSLGADITDSSERMKAQLMQYLPGMTVDHYMVMGMDALQVMNDALGGITVTVREDMAEAVPGMEPGERKLQGYEALAYVQTQTDSDNSDRMQRQEAYLRGFHEALQESIRQDPEFFLEFYESAAPYLATDCTAAALKSSMDRFALYPLEQVLTPEGTLSPEGEAYRFRADPDKLDQLILELFYAPKA